MHGLGAGHIFSPPVSVGSTTLGAKGAGLEVEGWQPPSRTLVVRRCHRGGTGGAGGGPNFIRPAGSKTDSTLTWR